MPHGRRAGGVGNGQQVASTWDWSASRDRRFGDADAHRREDQDEEDSDARREYVA